MERTGVVYVIRTLENIPLYVGSTIRYSNRISDHNSNKKKLQPRQPIQDYLREHSIEYNILKVYQITSNNKEDLLKQIHKIEQQWILYYLDNFKLLNKQNTNAIVTNHKRTYPWLSNQAILEDIYKIKLPLNNI